MNLRRRLRDLVYRISYQLNAPLHRAIQTNILLTGQLHAQRIRQMGKLDRLAEAEFRAFSQWGEDGIIQYLVSVLPIENRAFIEFGVENYLEANTRFLLLNDNWRGMVLDGSQANVDFIKGDPIYWQHELVAEQLFIDRDNINAAFLRHGFSDDIGLLSIDIDGNDYWVWDAIDCVSPGIIVCEYNSLFGAELALTVPYDASFVRSEAHYSNLYYGASLAALCQLADARGYDCVGTNSAGSNAFFVRRELDHELPRLSASQAYVACKVRESRDRDGRQTYLAGDDRLRAIGHLPLLNLASGEQATVAKLLLS